MIFLNGLMAIGGLAFALPLAIHLLYRSRYVTLEWGAMHLLANSRLTNTRSIQWHQLLLLLLRCLLPILLALTMSRPLIESWRNVDGRSAMSVAIVLDDSLSMFARQPADTRRDDNVQSVTRFSHACAAAASILDALPSGSDAAVVLAGAKPLTLDSHLPNELSTRLKQLSQRDVPAGNLQIRDALDAAERWLSSSSIAKRLLIIVTDAQEFDWSEMVTSKSLRFSHQAVRHETAFLNIGPSESSSAMNTFIDSISVSPSLIGVGDEVAIHVSLETHGNWVPSSAAHQIATFVDDVEIDRRDIQSANRHSFEVPWSPRTLGCHVIRVESLQEDELLTDNRLSLPVIVRQPVRVLLVNGKENNVSNLGESGFLRLALTPFSGSPQEHRTVFAVKTITLSELDEDVIRGFKTIFLCNVAELTANQQSWLNKYTSAGNGLVVLLGDQVQVDRYRTWPIASQGGIRIVDLMERQDTQSLDLDYAVRVDVRQIDSPALRKMSAVSLDSLASTRFSFRTPMSSLHDSNETVAMRFEDGQPWIVETSVGAGRCIWIGSSFNSQDSNLTSKPVFVPLVQKLAAYAGGIDSSSGVIDSSSVWNCELRGDNPQSTVRKPMSILVSKPDGLSETIVSENGRLHFENTRLLGTYSARPAGDSELMGAEYVCAVSVWNNDRAQESKLSALAASDISLLQEAFGGRVYNDSGAIIDSMHHQSNGREIWTWFWIALLICFVAEMAIQQWSPRRARRKASADRNSPSGNRP